MSKFKLVLILTVIPAVGIVVFGLILGNLENSWQDALRSNYPNSNQELLREATLKKTCADPGFGVKLGEICGTDRWIRRLRDLSVLVLVASYAYLGLVFLAGRFARKNRNLLLHVFSPGLYMANYFVSAVLVLHGCILVASIWYGESAWLGRVHVKLVAAAGIAAVAGAYSVVRASIGRVSKARTEVFGIPVGEPEGPQLWSYARSLAKEIGTEPPDNIVVGLDPNFFVTEADVRSNGGEHTGRTLYLSAPLCRILSLEELRAVLAHEFGHFHGEDTRFSLKFYPIYRGAVDSLEGLGQTASGSGFSGFALLPSIYMLGFFLECFSEAENKISRERELAADALAARHAGAANLAIALVKIVAFSGQWDRVIESLVKRSLEEKGKPGELAANEGAPAANTSLMFARLVARNPSREALQGLDAVQIPHPTDSHPPLSVRLDELDSPLSKVAGPSLLLSPEPAGISVLDNAEEIELQLSSVQRQAIENYASGFEEAAESLSGVEQS